MCVNVNIAVALFSLQSTVCGPCEWEQYNYLIEGTNLRLTLNFPKYEHVGIGCSNKDSKSNLNKLHIIWHTTVRFGSLREYEYRNVSVVRCFAYYGQAFIVGNSITDQIAFQ